MIRNYSDGDVGYFDAAYFLMSRNMHKEIYEDGKRVGEKSFSVMDESQQWTIWDCVAYHKELEKYISRTTANIAVVNMFIKQMNHISKNPDNYCKIHDNLFQFRGILNNLQDNFVTVCYAAKCLKKKMDAVRINMHSSSSVDSNAIIKRVLSYYKKGDSCQKSLQDLQGVILSLTDLTEEVLNEGSIHTNASRYDLSKVRESVTHALEPGMDDIFVNYTKYWKRDITKLCEEDRKKKQDIAVKPWISANLKSEDQVFMTHSNGKLMEVIPIISKDTPTNNAMRYVMHPVKYHWQSPTAPVPDSTMMQDALDARYPFYLRRSILFSDELLLLPVKEGEVLPSLYMALYELDIKDISSSNKEKKKKGVQI